MDRISSLPDEVLCHILSFLRTKYAALTRVLSKRWLNLLKFVPNLDIDDTQFLHPEDGKGKRVEIQQSFVEFMDIVLAMQGDSPIEKFSLKCITGIHRDCVNRWICNVLGRGVSDLDLYIDCSNENTDLHLDMFVSKTLVKLKILSEHYVNWWSGDMEASLPMLKSLYIDSDLIRCGDIKTVLEELRMLNVGWNKLDVTVSSSSLKKLTLCGSGYEDMENPKSISFDTPNLLFLDYSDVVAEDYPLVNMKKLLEACISLMVSEYQINRIRGPNNGLLEDDDVVLNFGNVVKLMKGIQNVEKLSLRYDTLNVLSSCCDSLLVFNNLIMLVIRSCEDGKHCQLF